MIKTLSDFEQPQFVGYEEIAKRWGCHISTVPRRLKLAGVNVVRFSENFILVRIEDILRLEERYTVPAGSPPKEPKLHWRTKKKLEEEEAACSLT